MTKTTYIIIACHIDKGMKSFGSKGLLVFNNKKLLEHQISWIKNKKNKGNQVIILADFDFPRLQKTFSKTTRVINNNNANPIYNGCSLADNNNICFIDYGCLFHGSVIDKLDKCKKSTIVTTNSSKDLDVGCIVNKNYNIEHMFIDLPDNKFCNMFLLSSDDISKVKTDLFFQRKNLLYFESLNRLVETGSQIDILNLKQKDFFYFNNMRQKNAISRFIKKCYN